MNRTGHVPTSHDAQPDQVDGREARRSGSLRPTGLAGALVVLMVVLGGCVDLTRPLVDDWCAGDGERCRPDGGDPDAGSDLAPRHDLVEPNDVRNPGDVALPADVTTPGDEGADSAEVPPPDTDQPDARPLDVGLPEDSAPDLPPDPSPDLAPDVQIEAPVDSPPDVTVADVPAPVVKGVCPTNDSSLLLCLRFEGSLADESPPPAVVTSNTVGYETGPSDLAVRVGPASVIRASQGWGTVGNTLTLEAWIRPDRLPTGSQRMGLIDEETRFGMFILPGGTLACSSAGVTVSVQAAVRVGQWSAVACTASSNTLVAWVDGLQRNQGGAAGNPGGATTNLAIGSNNPSGDAFEGLMDNVRVWNVVRTGSQICQAALGCP
jgi:hypothetical protein